MSSTLDRKVEKMGGNLVVAGTPEEIAQCAASYTGQFLKEKYL